jgi:hypothetical protein
MMDTDTERGEAQTGMAEVLRLRARIRQLEAENAALRVAYTRRTQLALAAGLTRWVVTGDAA